MTILLSDLPETDGPFYQRLADAVAARISTGTLAAGTRLPTQRELAEQLGTTVGTVGRAYTLLTERGLVSGEVGRGTYVNAPAVSSPAGLPDEPILAKLEEIAGHLAAIRALLERSAAAQGPDSGD